MLRYGFAAAAAGLATLGAAAEQEEQTQTGTTEKTHFSEILAKILIFDFLWYQSVFWLIPCDPA